MSTRERLLKQATKLFAAKGYDGAATEAIVRAARVNKRMLYHWFESKEGLYRAVLEAQFVALGAAFGELGSEGGQADLLLQIVDLSFDHVAAHPEFVRLAMWEGLRGGDTSRSPRARRPRATRRPPSDRCGPSRRCRRSRAPSTTPR